MKKTALIVALGKSPEPVACSIQGHKPDFVCFYTSQESVESIPLVRQKASHQFSDHKVLVEEIEDLQHCYERALNCCRKVEEQGFKPEEIVVDYTGGTKPMTAALVLAGITRGYRFCYVGGRERDNERRGIVVEGTSELRHSENPWDVLAVSDLEQIAWAFNRHAYSLAATLAEQLLERQGLSTRVRRLLEALVPLFRAYEAWDRFEHRKIGDGLKIGLEKLESMIELAGLEGLAPVVDAVRQNLHFYNEFRNKTRNFSGDVPGSLHVADLVSNARRRASEEKFDDAVARLYRALEMRAQVALACHSIRTGQVRPEQVPDALRDEFVSRYGSEDGKLKIPLFAAYRLLAGLNDPCGHAFFANEGEFNKILAARNQSILAHGSAVQSRDGFEKFLSLVEPLLDSPCPVFPSLQTDNLL